MSTTAIDRAWNDLPGVLRAHPGIKTLRAAFEAAAGGAPAPAPAPAASDDTAWREVVATAYGHLWCINTEPAAPITIYPPEQAAAVARLMLLQLLTVQEQCDGIKRAREALGDR